MRLLVFLLCIVTTQASLSCLRDLRRSHDYHMCFRTYWTWPWSCPSIFLWENREKIVRFATYLAVVDAVVFVCAFCVHLIY